jgi:hypothetical protein
MKATRHHDHMLTAQFSKNQFSSMAFHGRNREMWDILIPYLFLNNHMFCKSAQSASQYHANSCFWRKLGSDVCVSFPNPHHFIHPENLPKDTFFPIPGSTAQYSE